MKCVLHGYTLNSLKWGPFFSSNTTDWSMMLLLSLHRTVCTRYEWDVRPHRGIFLELARILQRLVHLSLCTLLSYTVYARQRNSRSAIILVNSHFFVSLPKGYFFLSQRGRRSKWSLGRFTKAKPISFRLSAVVVKMVTRPQPNLLIWATREKRHPKR